MTYNGYEELPVIVEDKIFRIIEKYNVDPVVLIKSIGAAMDGKSFIAADKDGDGVAGIVVGSTSFVKEVADLLVKEKQATVANDLPEDD